VSQLKLKLIEQHPGYFVVEGNLTFSSINKKTVKSLNCSQSAEQICIDLKNVKTTDSAGLALMIEWIKQCRIHNAHLSFKNIPEQLLTLAKLSGFDNNEYFVNSVH